MKTIRFIIFFGILPALIHAQSVNYYEKEFDFSTNLDTLVNRIDTNEGNLKLHTNKWLMCFMHWPLLNTENFEQN
jgi:hypothetical protein